MLRFISLATLIATASVQAQQLQPGVFASSRMSDLPLPAKGYDAYLLGELHGLAENERLQSEYLRILAAEAGLRDVAIEEKGVYQEAARAFTDGRAPALPHELCLRAGILHRIRALNLGRKPQDRIRVHLVDVDSPAVAIQRHLESLRARLNANHVVIPDAAAIRDRGSLAVAELRKLPLGPAERAELRTIELSILSCQQGFEAGIGPAKGSAYLDSREEAIAANIIDLIRVRRLGPVLALYGADHVSRIPRRDGGPERNQPFDPMAVRLERAGLRIAVVVTFPLRARAFWRTKRYDLPWTPQDGHLATGETFGTVFGRHPGTRLLYIDRRKHAPVLPSQDITRMNVDGYLLFPAGTPMADRCGK